VNGERERRTEGDWVGFERPSGEGGYKPCGLKWVFFVLVVVVKGREIGGYEAKRGVLCTEVEEVVRVKLAFFYNTAARCALGYAAVCGCCCGAAALCGGAVGALHCLVVVNLGILVVFCLLWDGIDFLKDGRAFK
jgi:hypothetical protein